jgi:copper chaperone CopZ
MTQGTEHERSSTSATLAISGMHCASCVALVEEVLGDEAGVSAVAVDLGQSVAHVSFDPSQTTLERLCAAIGAVGYGAAPRREAT